MNPVDGRIRNDPRFDPGKTGDGVVTSSSLLWLVALHPFADKTSTFFSFRLGAARSGPRVAGGADARPVHQARPRVADGLPRA